MAENEQSKSKAVKFSWDGTLDDLTAGWCRVSGWTHINNWLLDTFGPRRAGLSSKATNDPAYRANHQIDGKADAEREDKTRPQ